MLDIQLIRDHPDKVKKAAVNKGIDKDVAKKTIDEILRLDKKLRELIQESEKLRAQRNQLTKADREKGIEIKKSLKNIEPELRKIEDNLFNDLLLRIPNPAAQDVKIGKDESDNEVIKKWGEPTKFSFKPKDHLELGEALDIIDVKRAAKVSGSRFAYLKNEAVLLEFALVQLALETLSKQGFSPIIPPTLIKRNSMRDMGYLEHMGNEDFYWVHGAHEKTSEGEKGYYLVGTAEQSIGPMHMGEVLNFKDLPLRYVGFSTSFRREAGSYGKDTRGILRVHQFDKIEMFSYSHPDKSDEEHEFLLEVEEKLFQALKIPYQVIKMCTGDLGAPAVRKYDIEAWMPGQDRYREVTSASNTTDFQARRLNIKYQEKGKKDFIHTLNGTAFAIGRTLIAILENNQQKDGSIKIPTVLQKYVGKKTIKPAK